MAPLTPFDRLKDLEFASYHGSNSLLQSLPYIVPFMSDTLRSVHLQSLAGTSKLDTTSFIDNFQPLLQLNRLTEVRLNFKLLEFQFTDSDLVTVAKAWPNIVDMGFAFKNLPPIPRLETIGTVGTHCRFLEKLTIPCVLGPDTHSIFNISAPPDHPLRELRVYAMTWSLRRSSTITSSLAQAFPNLRGVHDTTCVPKCPAHREDTDSKLSCRNDLVELLWAILPPYILCTYTLYMSRYSLVFC